MIVAEPVENEGAQRRLRTIGVLLVWTEATDGKVRPALRSASQVAPKKLEHCRGTEGGVLAPVVVVSASAKHGASRTATSIMGGAHVKTPETANKA